MEKDVAEVGRREGVRERPVALIELFYDLVYVYAISKMTSIFQGEGLSAHAFARYLVASLVVLQAWMYMTNYVNRFGRERWGENVAIVVNMCAAVFMSNTISAAWSEMLVGFNASMLAMLGTVAVLYATHLGADGSSRTMAVFSLKTLLPVCAIYLLVAVAAPVLGPRVALGLDALAIVVGIFGPALVDRGMTLDVTMISFPHLAERFELITIITFGESVVTVAEVCERVGLSASFLMTFGMVIALFGCYVVQMHNLVEHHQVQRGLRLIYCHFAMVIALNLLTVCLNLLMESPMPTPAVCLLAAASTATFFCCLFLLSKYHRAGVSFGARDWVALAAMVLLGCALTFSGLALGMEGLLLGPLAAGVGCFAYLLAMDKGISVWHTPGR